MYVSKQLTAAHNAILRASLLQYTCSSNRKTSHVSKLQTQPSSCHNGIKEHDLVPMNSCKFHWRRVCKINFDWLDQNTEGGGIPTLFERKHKIYTN